MMEDRPDETKLPPGESGDSEDRDLSQLFRRTAPEIPRLDPAGLLQNVGAIPREWRASSGRRLIVAAAAILLLLTGGFGGWWIARSAARAEAAEFEDALARTRKLIHLDLAEALRLTQNALLDEQQMARKRLAILLRDDYRARIAALETEIKGVALLVSSQ